MPASCAHLVCSYKIQSEAFPLNIYKGEDIRFAAQVFKYSCFRTIKIQPSPSDLTWLMWPWFEGVASTYPHRNYAAPKKLMWLKAFTVLTTIYNLKWTWVKKGTVNLINWDSYFTNWDNFPNKLYIPKMFLVDIGRTFSFAQRGWMHEWGLQADAFFRVDGHKSADGPNLSTQILGKPIHISAYVPFGIRIVCIKIL